MASETGIYVDASNRVIYVVRGVETSAEELARYLLEQVERFEANQTKAIETVYAERDGALARTRALEDENRKLFEQVKDLEEQLRQTRPKHRK